MRNLCFIDWHSFPNIRWTRIKFIRSYIRISAVDTNMDIHYQEILLHKTLTVDDRKKDLEKLKKWNALTNERKFCGNPFLYHHQLKNLLETRIGNRLLLREVCQDKEQYDKLLASVEQRNRTGTLANRVFECYRVNQGSCVFFKASTAKFIYQKYKCSHVLDFTAGWGGRMLGAWALGIAYTEIDTNESLKPAYKDMLQDLENPSNICMIWDSCLNVDLSKIDYDFVLTSPPYYNLELYEHMKPFASKQAFYGSFLINMINRCRQNIKRNGKVAINISPSMYKELLSYGYEPCAEEHNLLQQKRKGVDKCDKIYIWTFTK